MQTKQQIQQLLASAGIRPNKRLGQHFLIDLNLMKLLIKSAQINIQDTVLEVGCGTGSLTEGLAEKAGKVIAVEFDKSLAKIAKKNLASKENVTVFHTDILEKKNLLNTTVTEALESSLKKNDGRLLLVANLPYNVASPVIVNLVTGIGQNSVTADAFYVTVQKEVADRMTAAPGTSHYGTISIYLAATGDIKLERVLKPTVFWPQPQVNSAMVSFLRSPEKANRIRDMRLFNEVVSLFMQHRRKMLKACTKFAAGKLTGIHNFSEIFDNCGIDPRQRPEQLSPKSFLNIANQCAEHLMSIE